MTPEQFVAHWGGTRLKESASYMTHFDDLCELVGHPKPAHMDKTGEKFTYQKGVVKAAAPLPQPRRTRKSKTDTQTIPLPVDVPTTIQPAADAPRGYAD